MEGESTILDTRKSVSMRHVRRFSFRLFFSACALFLCSRLIIIVTFGVPFDSDHSNIYLYVDAAESAARTHMSILIGNMMLLACLLVSLYGSGKSAVTQKAPRSPQKSSHPDTRVNFSRQCSSVLLVLVLVLLALSSHSRDFLFSK